LQVEDPYRHAETGSTRAVEGEAGLGWLRRCNALWKSK
jgi:hypothetical protein